MAERKRLGDILIQSGKITDHHVQLALEAQKNGSTQNIGALLIGMGFITEEDVAITLSDQLGIPYGTLENGMLKPSNVEILKEKVDEKFARKNGVLPIALNAGKLTVA
ncbi:MAG: type II secretion system protein GspE, partial [Candidatus Omnitrophica bacterium]|nr:type II secretion system protein GspE [Candidatus Omnitrophota bacterium]